MGEYFYDIKKIQTFLKQEIKIEKHREKNLTSLATLKLTMSIHQKTS